MYIYILWKVIYGTILSWKKLVVSLERKLMMKIVKIWDIKDKSSYGIQIVGGFIVFI